MAKQKISRLGELSQQRKLARSLFRKRTYSHANRRKPKDFTTNDGIVEGVWMFCRHGDRTPSRALSPAHRQADEASYWMTKLPTPDSAAAFEAYSRHFPLQIHPGFNQGKFIDAKRNPFGFLTREGLQQLKENGHRFFNRYNHHGHHQPDRATWRWEIAQDFLSVWDVSVYSTNYLRTVMSVQSFLDGLLGTNSYTPGSERKIDANVRKEIRVPNHSWRRDFDDEPIVHVQVRDLSQDPLNAFDRNPDLMADLINEVMLSEDFRKRDGLAAPLAARLANILPGLVRRNRSDFSARSPSGINWVEAADHFVCRAAHDVSFAKFSDFEHDDRVEQLLAAMSHQTLAHLSWRFRQWYQSERLLAAIAAPPLREICNQLQATPDLGVNERRPFVIYSCHDITILGLLYGIGADFLADDASSDWRFWPGYGSNLSFELVRIQEGGVGEDSHIVRVLLNGKTVLSVDSDRIQDGVAPFVGLGPDNLLRVVDFMDLVSKLEDAGGHDYGRLLGQK